jgi:hypothetical protein
MTKDEALKLALEAMEYADACLKKQLTMKYKHEYAQDLLLEAGTAIKEALAQPEQLREENERLHVENRRLIDRIETIGVPVGVGGFATTTTSQPDWIERERAVGYREGHRAALAQRTWIGLTEDEILSISADCASSHQHMDIHFARAIEAKLRSKNS